MRSIIASQWYKPFERLKANIFVIDTFARDKGLHRARGAFTSRTSDFRSLLVAAVISALQLMPFVQHLGIELDLKQNAHNQIVIWKTRAHSIAL